MSDTKTLPITAEMIQAGLDCLPEETVCQTVMGACLEDAFNAMLEAAPPQAPVSHHDDRNYDCPATALGDTVPGRCICKPAPQAPVSEIPTGAIENGREFMRRLEDHYRFGSGGVSLYACPEWAELKRCFEHLAEHCQTEPQAPVSGFVDIVFDGPPSHESGRFVEVENDSGASIRFGEWVEREDGFWALRIAQTTQPPTAELLALVDELEGVECGVLSPGFREAAKKLRSKLDNLPGSEWLPIESAPKDGRTMLLGFYNSHKNWRTLRGCWMTQEYIDEYWEDPDCDFPGWYEESVEADDVPNFWPTKPTHWMPLPKPPTKQESE